MSPHLYMKNSGRYDWQYNRKNYTFHIKMAGMTNMEEAMVICEVHQKPEPYLLKFLKAAVSSSSPLISRGYGSPFTKVNGFISRNEKSKSAKEPMSIISYVEC